MSPSEKFQQALALHEAGQLAQAQSVYEEILSLESRHCDAINLLGAIAIQTKNPQRAVELFGRAIEIDPNNVAAYCNSGWALQQLKAAEESAC
jgi:tetratricopeptide (TPR) repeat protein